MKKFLTLIAVVSAGALVLARCSSQGEAKDVVAQVGNAVLTLEQLQNRFPAEYHHLIKKEQYLDYIKRWMDEEILYQHALDLDLESKPEVLEKINDARKKIIVEYLTSHELSNVEYTPEEAAIRQYYEANQDKFLREEPEAKVLQIRLEGDKLAWNIHNKIREDNFWELAKENSTLDQGESIQDVPFLKQSQIDPCFADLAFSMRIGGTSSPRKCEDGVYIVRVVERKDPGTQKELEDVRGEIKDILAQKWYQRSLTQKIDDLKKELYISSNVDLIPAPQE